MTKYRKKPVVVYAQRWSDQGLTVPPVPHQFRRSTARFFSIVPKWELLTLHGWVPIQPGDWMICGGESDWWPCKPDVFAATYELADLLTEEVEAKDEPMTSGQIAAIQRYGKAVAQGAYGETLSALMWKIARAFRSEPRTEEGDNG